MTPCPSCDRADQWLDLPGGGRVCECSPAFPLVRRLAAAMSDHLRAFPGTTSEDIRLAVALATEVLPSGESMAFVYETYSSLSGTVDRIVADDLGCPRSALLALLRKPAEVERLTAVAGGRDNLLYAAGALYNHGLPCTCGSAH